MNKPGVPDVKVPFNTYKPRKPRRRKPTLDDLERLDAEQALEVQRRLKAEFLERQARRAA
jgi:hypothetical protein